MKRGSRVAGTIVVVIILVIAGGITFTIGWRPFIGPRARPLTGRTFESTPERLERGRYLANGMLGCMACHSVRDWSKHDAPLAEGMLGAGDIFPVKGVPGKVVAPNLTPDKETGAGNWTDDQLARAIREGVGHDGRALFPLMPYQNFRNLPDEDLASVIVYLRSLAPVRHATPPTEIIFPVKYLIRDVPQPLTQPVPSPDFSTPAQRGKFLVTVAGCGDCHTPMKRGDPIPGLELAGGQIFEGPWGRTATANITPDASGISYYDEALFAQAVRTGYVKARPLSPIMPWWTFRNMTDEDLRAMFAYLRTAKPVKHRVDNLEAASACKICGNVHGLGNGN
jgi:mono/diheme cytochrome c family protein